MMVSGSGVRQVSRFLLGGFGGLCGTVLEAEAVVPSFKNVTAMSETVEQGSRHLRVAEHGCPFAEAEISRDDDAGALIELPQQMEEQRSAGGAERQVAKLVEDDGPRVESRFVDDADIDAVGPLMLRAAAFAAAPEFVAADLA